MFRNTQVNSDQSSTSLTKRRPEGQFKPGQKVSGLFLGQRIAKLMAWENHDVGRSWRAWFRRAWTGDGPPPPPPWAERVNKPLTRRETARSANQRQPRHAVGRRDLGSIHRAATQPPVAPATTGKTEKRVRTPFLTAKKAADGCPSAALFFQIMPHVDPRWGGRSQPGGPWDRDLRCS